MPGITGWPSVGSPKRAGEREVLVGRQVLAGEEHDLAVEPHPADGGDGGVVEGAQVEAADLGADRAGQRARRRGRRQRRGCPGAVGVGEGHGFVLVVGTGCRSRQVGGSPWAPSATSSTPSSASSRARRARNAGWPRSRGRGTSTGRSSEMRAVGEHEHPVGEQDRLVDVVGDQQDRGPVAGAQLLDEGVHPHPGQGVEGAERLVEQQQLGLADQRPGQRRPLGLAARQGLGPVVLVAGQARPRRSAWPAPGVGDRRRRGRAPRCRARRPTAAGGRPGTRPSAARARGRRPSAPASSPARIRSSVVLPEPDRPSRATNSPAPMSRSMPRRTERSPKSRRRSSTATAETGGRAARACQSAVSVRAATAATSARAPARRRRTAGRAPRR